MECNVQEDDLLGEDLMEMEDGVQPYIQGVTSKAKVIKHGSKTAKGSTVKGNKNNVPLGIQSRKTEFLRRVSPSKRSTTSTGQGKTEKAKRPRHKKSVGIVPAKKDGLMDSKNPSKHHL